VSAQNWFQLQTGTNDDVRALTEYNNSVVAGGSFTVAGVLNASRIAKWDGTSWVGAFGLGFNNDVRALTDTMVTLQQEIYLLEDLCQQIARWNGISWLPLAPV
jgi:hypothetical protein